MKRQLYTAEIIENLAAAGETTLILSRGDIVTPLARDRARELGLTLVWPEADDRALPAWSAAAQARATALTVVTPAARGENNDLESRVRQVVAQILGERIAPAPDARASAKRILHVDGRGVKLKSFPFTFPGPEIDVRQADVITGADGAAMTAGFMTLHQGQFPLTLIYDEIAYVIEGELHISSDGRVVVGLPGDVIFLPKGSHIQLATPSWAKFFYVTYPASSPGASNSR